MEVESSPLARRQALADALPEPCGCRRIGELETVTRVYLNLSPGEESGWNRVLTPVDIVYGPLRHISIHQSLVPLRLPAYLVCHNRLEIGPNPESPSPPDANLHGDSLLRMAGLVHHFARAQATTVRATQEDQHPEQTRISL